MTRSDTHATFRGGPLSGEKRVLEGTPDEFTARALDPEQASRIRRGAVIGRAEPLRYVEHRYRRTNDWLRDGSVVYEYTGAFD